MHDSCGQRTFEKIYNNIEIKKFCKQNYQIIQSYQIKLKSKNYRDYNEGQFLPSSNPVDTAIWMHHMDAD